MRFYSKFIQFCSFFTILSLSFSTQIAGQPSIVLNNERLESLTVENIKVANNIQSHNITGTAIELFINDKQNGFGSMSYELYLVCFGKDGRPIRVNNEFSIYSNETGEFVVNKFFQLTKYRSFFSDSPTWSYKLYDEDSKKMTTESVSKKGIALQTFIPYYALKLPKGEQAITAKFYFRNLPAFWDSTTTQTYYSPKGINKTALNFDQPKVVKLLTSVDEVHIQPEDVDGNEWDIDLQQNGGASPDLQWKVSLQTAFKEEVIYTSKIADNAFFNKWLYEYTPPFWVAETDKISFTVVDIDTFSPSDDIGNWDGTYLEIIQQANSKTALKNVGQVSRMQLNPPKLSAHVELNAIQLSKKQDWDIYSFFLDIEPPDLYCIISLNDTEELYASKVVDNSYELNFTDVNFKLDLSTNDTLFIKLYDQDIFYPDFIGTIKVPVQQLFSGDKQLYFVDEEIGEVLFTIR